MSTIPEEEARDRRFMAAAIRYSLRNAGLTGTNPAVGTLIVSDDMIVGRGVTAIGGRPHAETEALAEAGEAARGATAYVTLEPCAHHGRTPPCAQALINSGVARVVGGAADPDPRVGGRGYAMLREAGVEVVESVLADEAADTLSGYLIRSVKKRPEVILKLALSRDGMIGRPGAGQVAITGQIARAQTRLLRAGCDAILIGIGTAIEDDPELTVRLPGLESRSPARIVLDPALRLPFTSRLVISARQTPLLVAAPPDAEPEKRRRLAEIGVDYLSVELIDGRIALPEFLEDLAARGMSRILVEGGARTAAFFLDEGLVDRLLLFEGDVELGAGGVRSPISPDTVPQGFSLLRDEVFGPDRCREYRKDG
jgi:diaminohydroxyphosphoribosylaminopyrimidine deaminase/5-amino-6-(5-phosphoribosylamino)uracil reductase